MAPARGAARDQLGRGMVSAGFASLNRTAVIPATARRSCFLLQHEKKWKDGKGLFSYSLGQLNAVKAYIENQWEHHRHITFREEYERWMASHRVSYTKFDLPEAAK